LSRSGNSGLRVVAANWQHSEGSESFAANQCRSQIVGYVEAEQSSGGRASVLRLAIGMNDSARLPVYRAACAALLAGLCAGMIGAGIFAAGVGGSFKPTDDWRRTAHGWEHISGWSNAARSPATTGFAAPPRPAAERVNHHGSRTDAHPAALALAQLVGSMLALAVFSPRGRSLLRGTSFSAILAGSFRASVFGS
jgi:hypothetical protein